MTEGPSTSSLFEAAVLDLAATSRLLVCCDFDGTISTLAEDPAAARPVDGAVAALDALATLPNTWAAVVSGRALIDLTQLSGMPESVHLVGSHGTEFEVGAILAVSPTETALLETVIAQCRALSIGVEGVVVEVKPASVAVHVRQSSRADAERLLTAVRAGPGSLPGVHILEGKEVVELAVFPGAKGDAISVLQDRWDITGTIFVGDDVTDESAFGVLTAGDMGVKVGDGQSLAAWRLPDPDSVVSLLARIAGLRGAATG
ncbi:MAG: trehalose-phosphatase [bacterium]|nr:trehalose-phosphatase [bacterium]